MTRTTKGEHRSEAIRQAAAELLLSGGPEAVTARAVASAAGVALGSVTYYFADVAELRRRAAQTLLQRHIEDAGRLAASIRRGASVRRTAQAVVAAVLGPYAEGGRSGVRALYARALAAADDPALAEEVAVWDAQLSAVLANLLHSAGRDGSRARAVLACTDGYALAEAMAASDDGPPENVAAAVAGRLAAVLDLLAPRR